MVLYTLILIPLVKYVLIVLWAKDESKGGIFALYSLLFRHEKVNLLPNKLRSDARISRFRLKMSSPELESSLEIKERLDASVTLKKLFLMLIFPGTPIVIADGVVTSAMSEHGMASLMHLAKNINASKIDSYEDVLQVIEQILEVICFNMHSFFYGTLIIGWANCRPVIMVDATFLKAKYHGVLMISVSKEGNNNIFPLAFGIADSENNESYNWFFNKLRHAIGVREQLSILSDHHPAIANAIANVYPECQHGICIYHIEKYLRKKILLKCGSITLLQRSNNI
ncbi:hypothetical protein P3S67_015401 [Capsicum chacoense]